MDLVGSARGRRGGLGIRRWGTRVRGPVINLRYLSVGEVGFLYPVTRRAKEKVCKTYAFQSIPFSWCPSIPTPPSHTRRLTAYPPLHREPIDTRLS